MENTLQYNVIPITISRTAQVIEKLHRCAECPIRKMAVKRPHSIFAVIHNRHRTWWLGWKAHQTRMCASAAARQK